MLTTDQFEIFLESSESSTLDFKAAMYDFQNDTDQKATSHFIKDIISFSNTVRNQSAYIIMGVKEKADKSKELLGLSENIDDAILQQKARSKVFPPPKFEFYTVKHEGKNFGIIEFPIYRHESPLYATVKVKGIEIGKVYYRQGTVNTEAYAIDVIRINDWFKTLPEHEHNITLDEEVSKALARLTADEKLSTVISQIYSIAKKYNVVDLQKFCTNELQGFSGIKYGDDEKDFKHRIQNIFISPVEVEINTYNRVSQSRLKKEFEINDNIFDYKMLFSQSIVYIENMLFNLSKENSLSVATMTQSSKTIFPTQDAAEYTVYIFIFEDHLQNLYGRIRQKAIDLLMNTTKHSHE